MAFSTNMSTLLSNVKQVFLDNKGTIGVSHLKKGVLPPLPVFPVIAILPISESIIQYRNNGAYVIQRGINIEVYDKNYDVKVANEKVKDIITNIVNVCQTQNQLGANRWSTSVFDSTWSDASYEQPFAYKNQIVQTGTLSMTFISNENMPIGRPSYVTVVETNFSDVLDQIYTIINSYVDGSDATFDLTAVKTIYKKEIPPIGNFPCITINGGVTSRERARTGEDTTNFSVEIVVWTKLLDKEWTLNQNLDLVEILKDVIQYNEQWNGKAVSSIINSIDYERANVNKIGFTYRTVFNITVEGVERV